MTIMASSVMNEVCCLYQPDMTCGDGIPVTWYVNTSTAGTRELVEHILDRYKFGKKCKATVTRIGDITGQIAEQVSPVTGSKNRWQITGFQTGSWFSILIATRVPDNIRLVIVTDKGVLNGSGFFETSNFDQSLIPIVTQDLSEGRNGGRHETAARLNMLTENLIYAGTWLADKSTYFNNGMLDDATKLKYLIAWGAHGVTTVSEAEIFYDNGWSPQQVSILHDVINHPDMISTAAWILSTIPKSKPRSPASQSLRNKLLGRANTATPKISQLRYLSNFETMVRVLRQTFGKQMGGRRNTRMGDRRSRVMVVQRSQICI